MRAIKDKPTEIFFWDSNPMGRSFCLYQDIEDYMFIRSRLKCGSDRFFMAANPHARSRGEFFTKQHLGKNSFSRIANDTCALLGIKGTGFAEGMTAHGLRGTVVSLLFENGSGDASVALRTGHLDLRSLQSCHNLQGRLGQQEDGIFGNETKKAKIDRGERGKEKIDTAPHQDSKSKEKEPPSVEGLLTGVEAISGGSFTLNVYDYR